VEAGSEREYGPAHLQVDQSLGIFSPFRQGDSLAVWMSHGDRITQLPEGFVCIGRSENAPFAAIGHAQRRIYGIQFHPEVAHTPRGSDLIGAFLFQVAGLKPDWTPSSFIESTVRDLRQQVKPGEKVLCALSGGVDSAVAAVLTHRAIGEQLVCVFVDNGVLREGEFDRVQHAMRDRLGLNLLAIDARERFLSQLSGVTDPEKKRKIIGHTFIDVFEEQARTIRDVRYLVQGTLYPDVIESISVKGPSAVIKTHHNVGGLPERMQLALIEPLRELFKDEVRRVGASLDMPADILGRQPFPGPGLAVRCLGEVTPARLEVLRAADAIVDEEIRAASG
jgi:GMP synthase (glutamine-hydrolysing)